MFSKRSAVTLPASPGSLLHAGRLENGWSRADVAGALCLTERQLQALESDDYQNLPGKTYILGYWKGYANLLGICIDPSIQAHKRRLADRCSNIALETDPQQLHGSIEQSRRRLAFLCGGLSVVFLASLWLWQQPDNGGNVGNGGNGIVAPAQSQSEPWWQWRRWFGRDTPAPDASGAPLAAPQAGSGGSQNSAASALIAEAPVVLPEPNFPQPPDASRPDERQGGAPPGAEEARPARSADGRVAPPEQIVVAVDQESWVEVHDGAGQRLIYRTVSRGQRLTLEGVLPFSVFIGNPEGVSVEYRGRQVPFTADRGGLFARFNIGVP